MAEDITGRLVRVADRVANVLREHGSHESGADRAADFLVGWAEGERSAPVTGAGALDRLTAAYNLTETECDLLVLAGLAEEHEGLAATFRGLHPQGEPYPTVGLAALVLGGTTSERRALRALLADGAAVVHGILLTSAGTFFERSLRPADGVWQALTGYDGWPADLPRVLLPGTAPRLDEWLQEDTQCRAVRAVADDDGSLVLTVGDEESVTLARCVAIARRAGRQPIAARLSAGDRDGVRLLAVHAAVRGAVPVAVVADAVDAPAEDVRLDDVPGTLLVCTRPGRVRPSSDRAVIAVRTDPVGARDRQDAWRAALPELTAEQVADLVDRYPLDPAVTAQLALDVRGNGSSLSRAGVAALVRARTATVLPPGVELVTSRVAWDDLVLPQEGAAQLAEAVARLGHQRLVLEDWGLGRRAHALRGIRLLLTGPPGTGKSLAARAVAAAVGVDLLVVDVSGIVSKWLGETEKNLAAAFDAAQRSQAVLMLDEADALFGKRTEISDAHDRYANLETAYLLQRLDRFEGLAILTTNLRANIDPAFLRRVDYVVEFPLPGHVSRTALWERLLPPFPLADDVDVDALAGLYPVPGAWIRNVSLAAAFAAAAAGTPLNQAHVVTAMRREYAKSSLPFPGEPPRRSHASAA